MDKDKKSDSVVKGGLKWIGKHPFFAILVVVGVLVIPFLVNQGIHGCPPSLEYRADPYYCYKKHSTQPTKSQSSFDDETLRYLRANLDEKIKIARNFIEVNCGLGSSLASIPPGVDSILLSMSATDMDKMIVDGNCDYARSMMDKVRP